jgi:hypothetical protein
MSNIYHIDPEAYERMTIEEAERAATDQALQEIWQIAVSQAKTNKPVAMSDGSHCCPHCGKSIEVPEEWWQAQDREVE